MNTDIVLIIVQSLINYERFSDTSPKQYIAEIKDDEIKMKTKFAKEKSEYALIIKELMNEENIAIVRLEYLKRLKELEQQVKSQNDELIFIVTTEKTNPIPDKSAPPMSMENIKND